MTLPLGQYLYVFSSVRPVLLSGPSIDARFVILWDLNFLKKGHGSSIFSKIRAIVLKLHTNILYRSKNFGIEYAQNRLRRSNFLRFSIFWDFSLNCLTQANFDLSSLNFLRKCTNIEWCLILSFVKIGRDLQILDEFEFFNFFYGDIKFWKFDESTKLPLWESQSQATYFPKEITL